MPLLPVLKLSRGSAAFVECLENKAVHSARDLLSNGHVKGAAAELVAVVDEARAAAAMTLRRW